VPVWLPKISLDTAHPSFSIVKALSIEGSGSPGKIGVEGEIGTVISVIFPLKGIFSGGNISFHLFLNFLTLLGFILVFSLNSF
jgi:hypothetical protein